jgi:hypothetical protein
MAATSPSDEDIAALADLDARDCRALTEYQTVFAVAPGVFDVVAEGPTYRVDLQQGVCECKDSRMRHVSCKHQRRVEFAIGARDIPAGVDPVGDLTVYEGDAR